MLRRHAAPGGVSYCRPGIHGVAPTVRQQDTPPGAPLFKGDRQLSSMVTWLNGVALSVSMVRF